MSDDFGNNFRIFQDDGVEIAAKSGFDRRNEPWINVEFSNERAGDRFPEFCAAINALEQSLRTFSETFSLFVQLTQHVETRSFFGKCAMECHKILFGLTE